MPYTPGTLQAKIMRELGEPENLDLLAYLQDTWDLYADRGLMIFRLQYLYVKQDAIDWLIGQIKEKADWTSLDKSRKDSQKIATLQTEREKVEGQILKLEATAKGNRAPATGEITATAPITPDFPGIQPDPNDRVYRGDPLRRRFGGGNKIY